jgi:transposase
MWKAKSGFHYWNGPPLLDQTDYLGWQEEVRHGYFYTWHRPEQDNVSCNWIQRRRRDLLSRKFSRTQLLHFTSNRQRMLIGVEASGGAHFLGRALRTQGHHARLMPAQFVKAFRKSNKNDYLDAQAIAEAAQRPTMRFVPIKTDDQLDLQALHRVRDRWVAKRTAVMNQMRGFHLERGITIRKGPSHLAT